MDEILKWLLEHGGVWGGIVACLVAVGAYLERSRRSLQSQIDAEKDKRIGELQAEISELEAYVKNLRRSRKADLRKYMETIHRIERECRQTIDTVSRWIQKR